jgi:hypothetical protein
MLFHSCTQTNERNNMGKHHDNDLAPLPPERATELERIINKAAQNQEVVLIDIDRGIVGSKPKNLISSQEKLNGLVRFGRHYQRDGAALMSAGEESQVRAAVFQSGFVNSQ